MLPLPDLASMLLILACAYCRYMGQFRPRNSASSPSRTHGLSSDAAAIGVLLAPMPMLMAIDSISEDSLLGYDPRLLRMLSELLLEGGQVIGLLRSCS